MSKGCTCRREARAWYGSGVCGTCGKRVLESQLTPVLLQILTGGTGLVLWRNSAGYDEARHVRYGLTPGAADYIGLYQGRYVEVEFKTARGKQSPDQISHEALVTKLGGIYAVIRTEVDAHALLTKLRGL